MRGVQTTSALPDFHLYISLFELALIFTETCKGFVLFTVNYQCYTEHKSFWATSTGTFCARTQRVNTYMRTYMYVCVDIYILNEISAWKM